MSLILHCGAHAMDRDTMSRLPEPTPGGPRHQPIHHFDLITQVESSLHDHGYDVTESAFGVTNDGARMFGVATVEHSALRGFRGGSYALGYRSSTDRSLAPALAAGINVFVCDNLSFSGEAVLSTKQTTHIRGRLPTLVDDLMERLRVYFSRASAQVERYRATEISSSAADAAILQMGRSGVINWGELGKVVEQWESPAHEEHLEDGASVWRLFNAATETLKPRNPDHPRLPHLASKTIALHSICDKLAA